MVKITDTIKPFVTPFEVPDLIDLRDKAAYCIAIRSDVATIYDDGCGNAITVPIWGYEGRFLGPTLVMNRGQKIDITWCNEVAEGQTLPCPAVRVPRENVNIIPQNVLGVEQAAEATMGHGCKPRFTTHLHGGKVPPASDGWPESMIMPRQNSLKRYENKQRAALIWYHDHAMHTTRLNVYAGMAGAWVITDEEEAALGLPDQYKENMLPLVIQDRNLAFETANSCQNLECGCNKAESKISCARYEDAERTLNAVFNSDQARLLHKVEGVTDGTPMEFFGPLTLVNGRVWPERFVEPTCYRLRILNGANSRTYGLAFAFCETEEGLYRYRLLSEDQVNAAVRQVGTDGGLLENPVTLPIKQLLKKKKYPEDNDEFVDAPLLLLSPAERADILIDFSCFANQKIVLLNCAASPFANQFIYPIDRLDGKDYSGADDLLAYPQVMRFDIAVSVAEPAPYDFAALDNRFAALQAGGTSSYETDKKKLSLPAQTRTIAIVEKTMGAGKPPMLVLWELLGCEQLQHCGAVLVSVQQVTIDEVPYYVVAERFQDPVSYMVQYGSTERWRFINLTADTHPMHMHLVQFMPTERWQMKVTRLAELIDISSSTKLELDLNEQGFKDTIRVNPSEMVEVKAHFDGYMGRYVYHCHLLEHEDHDMMRQFVVTRDDLDMHTLPVSVGK